MRRNQVAGNEPGSLRFRAETAGLPTYTEGSDIGRRCPIKLKVLGIRREECGGGLGPKNRGGHVHWDLAGQ